MTGRLGLQIRPATFDDVDGLVRISKSIPELPQWSSLMFRQIVEQVTPDVLRFMPVGEIAGETVAFGVLTLLPGIRPVQGEVENLAVSPEWRCRGFGKVILLRMLDEARSRAAASVHLEVRSRNVAALRLYHSMDFVSIGRRRDYYANPADDAVLLRVHLTGRQEASIASGMIED